MVSKTNLKTHHSHLQTHTHLDPIEEVESAIGDIEREELERDIDGEREPLLAHAHIPTQQPWYRISTLSMRSSFLQGCKGDNTIEARRQRTRLTILGLIPLVQFSGTLAITTAIDVFRTILCVLWYAVHESHGGSFRGLTEPDDDGRCDVDGVNSWFSSFVLIVSICMAVGTFFSSTIIGFLAPRIGRRPLQITYMTLSTIAHLLLPLALKITPWLLIPWLIIDSIASPTIIHLLFNVSLTDLTNDDERTTYLLFAAGLMAIGAAPSFVIGGLITAYSGSTLTVFFVGGGMLAFTTLVFALTVDETFGKEKRDERRREVERERELSLERDPNRSRNLQTNTFRAFLVRTKNSITAPFHLLGRLLPTRDPLTRQWNYRLFVLGLSFFLASYVKKYVQGVVVYATTKFHFTAEENGIMMSSITTSSVIWLMVLSPALLRYMERWYKPLPGSSVSNGGNDHLHPENGLQEQSLSSSDDDDSIDGLILGPDNLAVPSGTNSQEISWRASMIARRDVHIIILSYCFEAAGEFCIGLANTGTQIILATLVMGCVGSSGPAVMSAAVASVPPLQSGEILATFEVVGSIAQLLSPLQGVLLTLLINKAPEVVFFMGGAISLIAVFLMFFVREKDRYIAKDR